MRQLDLRIPLVLAAILGALGFTGCDEDSEDPPATTEELTEIQQQLAFCTEDGICPPDSVGQLCLDGQPCAWLARADTSGLSGDALREHLSDALLDGDSVEVFDGLQGVVASWFTVVVANEVSSDISPRVRIELIESSETLNVAGMLNIPVQELGSGVRYRSKFMQEYIGSCCAIDFQSKEIDVKLTVAFRDATGEVNTVFEHTFSAVLAESAPPPESG